MKKTLLLLPAMAFLMGCDNGPRDATNDPDVQYMLKGVNEQGKMPGGGAPTTPAGQGSEATPKPTAVDGSAPIPQTPLANP